MTPPHIIKIKKIIGAAGEIARPTNRRKRLVSQQTPRGAHPCRAACMPPLRMRYTRLRRKTLQQGERLRAACMRPLQTGRRRQVNGKAGVFRRPARPRTRAGFQNGSPDEPYRQQRNGIVTESLCLVRNANRLGRPPQSPGVSKGARRPLWPCPAPRN